MPKLIRITTAPLSLKYLLPGQMKYMSENGFDVIMVSSEGKEKNDVIVREGCRHQVIDMSRKITPARDLRSVWSMYKFFRQEKPDIVHSHTPKAGLVSMLAARMAGVPVRIHTIAGLRFATTTGSMRKMLMAMEKLTASAATHVWPNSASLFRYIKAHKLAPEKKLSMVGKGSSNGVDLQRYSPASLSAEKLEETRQLMKYDENNTYLLTIGRMVKDKGIEELLEVFTGLYKKDNKLRLVLVGSFEKDLDPLSEESHKILEAHPAIIHIPWSDHVEYFMHLADLLVHPSHREGFPNVLLQAGAMLCPIVCSDIDGNIDVVEHRNTGLIFKVKDKMDLAEKLNEALASPEEMKDSANKLRAVIEQNFDQRVVHRHLKEAYLKALNERN